jgi:hypothetical protein
MKILIDPMLAILAKDLPDCDKAEILMCILEYPSRDCNLSLWRYMRQQIDRDAEKYREKCDRMAENGRKRWQSRSDAINSKLEVSKENVEVCKQNINKDNCNVSERGNVRQFVENSVDKFQITGAFSFEAIGRANPSFANYIKLYLPPIVARAEKTLKEKRHGQWLDFQQIIDWLELERGYYAQNHGGKA